MDKFSFRHVFFIICAVSIASQKTYPEIFVNLSGRDGWITDIIASGIMLIYFDYIINICIKNNCYSIIEIFYKAFGKFMGRVFLAVFMIAIFMAMLECISVESSVVHTNLFIESPIWYIALFSVIPGFYVMKNGKQSVMIVLIISMGISIFNGINLAMLTAHYKDYRRLFPILKNGFDVNFFISIVKTVGMYSSISITIPYLAHLKKDTRLRKYAFMSNLFVAQMVVVSTIGLLATFNAERSSTMVYAKLIQTQLVSYFGFIASGEFYVIFQTIASWFAKYVASFLSLMILFRDMNVKMFTKSKKIYVIFSVLVYVISNFLARKLLVLFDILNIYLYICVAVFFILPILAFTIFNMRNKASLDSVKVGG